MPASRLLISFILLALGSAQQAHYYFSENFGQVFHDYSSNLNSAVNGNSTNSTFHDTIPLDRGAYFTSIDSSQSSFISLPRNEIVSKSFSSESGLYVALWVLFDDELDKPERNLSILSRFDENSRFLLQLSRNSRTGQLACQYTTAENASFDHVSVYYSAKGSNYYAGVWDFIIFGVAYDKIEVYLSNIPIMALELPSAYVEPSSPLFVIGDKVRSFKGIVFELYVFASKIDSSAFIGGQYVPGNCLLPNCPKSCNPSYISDNYQFCLPTSTDYQSDSQGNPCEKTKGPGPLFGCYKEISLECNCSSKSCIIDNDKVKCWCSKEHFCNCPIQMFFNTIQCVACHPDCSTCDTLNLCTGCIADYSEPSENKGCKCKEGYFNLTTLNEKSACLQCRSECQTCKDSETCETCKDSNAEFKKGQCRCKAGFYSGAKGLCEQCEEDCGSCEKIGACLTCKDSNAKVVNGKCVCADRYYNISQISGEGSCLFCNLECVSCDAFGMCTECVSENSVKDDKGGCRCQEGYYNVSSLFVKDSCLRCNSECLSCSQEGHCDKCVALNASPYLDGCKCDLGYYNVSQLVRQDSCLKCHLDCLSCDDSSKCLLCKDQNAYPDKSNGCVCNAGYSNNTSISFNGACKICDSSCETCDSDYNCLSCKSDNSEIQASKRGCKCLENYYNTSELIHKDSCKPCLETCKTCKSSDTCESCKSAHAIATEKGCKCQDQYYNTSLLTTESSCINCHPDCLTCSSSTKCQTCISHNAVPGHSGCICKQEYYNTTSLTSPQSCLKCHQDCLTCNSPSTCLTCKDPNSSPSDQGCSCLAGFYSVAQNNTIKCLPCNNDCLTCNSNATCLTCISNHTEINKFGCKCVNGYYNNSLLTQPDSCKPCKSECFNCTVADKCDMCKAKHSYPSVDGCKCFNGYFNVSKLDEGGNCFECHKDCLHCENNKSCTECRTEFAQPSVSGCECIEGFHNISALEEEDSCIDIDLYSIKVIPSLKNPTALFWFSVVVKLENKEGQLMQSPVNVTLFSHSEDLSPPENLTKLSTNGTLTFEVYCKNSGGNSLGVKIGPVSGIAFLNILPTAFKIHSIRPTPVFESDNFELEVGVYNFDKTQLGTNIEDFWIYIELNPEGDLKGQIDIKTSNGIGVFSGLRISTAGFYKLQIKSNGKQTATSNLIEIKHDPVMGVRVLTEPKLPTIGFLFVLNVTLADQYGKLFGEDHNINLKVDKKVQGELSKRTVNSNALFELRCMELGSLNVFVDAEVFNGSFVVNIKKNVLESRILFGDSEEFRNGTVDDEFSVSVRVMNKVGGEVEEFYGQYYVELALEPFGEIKCGKQNLITDGGIGRFDKCRILTSGSVTVVALSNLTEPGKVGPIVIRNLEIQSISLLVPEKTSIYVDFNIDFLVFDSNHQIFTQSCILNLTGPLELHGPSLIFYQKGVVSMPFYSTLLGINHISLSLLDTQATNLTEVLPNLVKIISFNPKVSIIQPIHADQIFSVTIGLFSYDGLQGVNRTGFFSFSIQLSPEHGLLIGKNETESVLPTHNFTSLQIATIGVFQIIANCINMTSSSSEFIYIDTPVFSTIIVNVNPKTPSVHFEAELEGKLLDQYENPWNEQVLISFEFEGVIKEIPVKGAEFKQKIIFEDAGVKKLGFKSGEVSSELIVPVLSLRLLPVSLVPTTLKLGNTLDLIYAIFDNPGKTIQSSKYHYQVSLEFDPNEGVEGELKTTTNNGYAIFSNINIKDSGLYKISACSANVIKYSSNIRTYVNTTVEVLISGLKTEMQSKILYEFSVSAQNISHDSKTNLDSTLIEVFSNSSLLEPILSSKTESFYSVIFSVPGEYEIKAVLGEYFGSVQVVVSASENTDVLCQLATSGEICDKCFKRAENVKGKCECVYNSEFSLESQQCECVDPKESSDEYCVPCGTYLSRDDIKAEFGSDYRSINVYFSVPAKYSELACSDVLLPGYYSDLLENCVWHSPFVLQLRFPKHLSLENSELVINNRKVLANIQACHYNIENLNIPIQEKFPVPVPKALIVAPQKFSTYCISSGLVIQSKYTSAEYIYKWSAQTIPDNTELRLLISSQTTEHFLIPFSYLNPVKIMLELTVQYANLKTSSKHRQTIEVINTKEPHVSLYEHYLDDTLTIVAKVQGECEGTEEFVYDWQVAQGNASEYIMQGRPDALVIPRSHLTQSEFEVSLKVSEGIFEIFNDFKLELVQKPLVISLSRSSGTVSNQEDLIVYFSVIDPNTLHPDLDVKWTCSELSGPCLDQFGKKVNLLVENSALIVKKQDLRDLAQLILTISAETSSKKEFSSISLNVNARTQGSTSLPLPSHRWNSDYIGNLITTNTLSGQYEFLWTVQGANECEKSMKLNFPFIQIPENCLSPGTTYRIQLDSYTKNTEKISSYGEIRVNQRPVCKGISLFEDSNKFLVSAQDCFDSEDQDYPLMYQVGCKTRNASIKWLTEAFTEPATSVWLPLDATEVLLRVIDSLGSFEIYSQKIEDKQRKLTDITLILEKDKRNLVSVPNLIVAYGSQNLDFNSFSLLFKMFTDYYTGSSLDRFGMDLYIECLTTIIDVNMSNTEDSKRISVELTTSVLDQYKFKLLDSQADALLNALDKHSLLSISKNSLQFINSISKALVTHTIPEFEHAYKGSFTLINTLKLSDSFKSSTVSSGPVLAHFPSAIDLPADSILLITFAYFPQLSGSSLTFQCLYLGTFTSYNLNLSKPTQIDLSLATPIKLSIETTQPYTSANCSNCEVLSVTSSHIELSIQNTGTFIIQEDSTCANRYLPVTVSGALTVLTLFGSVLLYLLDKKKRLIDSSGFDFIDLFNLVSLFRPRQSLQRVLSLFKLSSSLLLITACTSLTFTPYLNLPEFPLPLSESLTINLGRCIFALVLSQILSFVNLIFSCCKKNTQETRRLLIFFNVLIVCFSVSIVYLASAFECLGSPDEWVYVCAISCVIETLMLQPLNSLCIWICVKKGRAGLGAEHKEEAKELESSEEDPINKEGKELKDKRRVVDLHKI